MDMAKYIQATTEQRLNRTRRLRYSAKLYVKEMERELAGKLAGDRVFLEGIIKNTKEQIQEYSDYIKKLKDGRK